jgi:hypothetical protein
MCPLQPRVASPFHLTGTVWFVWHLLTLSPVLAGGCWSPELCFPDKKTKVAKNQLIPPISSCSSWGTGADSTGGFGIRQAWI